MCLCVFYGNHRADFSQTQHIQPANKCIQHCFHWCVHCVAGANWKHMTGNRRFQLIKITYTTWCYRALYVNDHSEASQHKAFNLHKLLSIWELRRPTFKKTTCGFGLTRLCLTTKVKNETKSLGIGMCLLMLACFFEGVVGDVCCSGIFEIWSKIADAISKSRQHRTQGVPGETKIAPRGYPPEVPKDRSRKQRANPGKSHAAGTKIVANIWIVGVLGGISFDVFPHDLGNVF